jgi:hypothetical protein
VRGAATKTTKANGDFVSFYVTGLSSQSANNVATSAISEDYFFADCTEFISLIPNPLPAAHEEALKRFRQDKL